MERFLPALQGQRALAALGVLTTHVAFSTGSLQVPIIGPVLGRLDMAVAVFFALSGFLLWRPHAEAVRGAAPEPGVGRYYQHRLVRIWPAYLVVTVAVLGWLPEARGASATVWWANLTLTQIYVPLTLTAGLTQMWSLAVEVSFYLVVPLLALLVRRVPVRWRVPTLLGVAALSLGWAPLTTTFSVAPGLSPSMWLPGHLPWFVAGMVLAELGVGNRWPRVFTNRVVMAAVALACFGVACTPLAGPIGLAPVGTAQFVVKIVLGAGLGWAVLAPYVRGPGARSRFLCSAPMQALGRWSYGIFIWHLAILTVLFHSAAVVPFRGNFVVMWALTVLVSVLVAAASYAFVEEPARRWLRLRENARRGTSGRAVATTADTATTSGA